MVIVLLLSASAKSRRRKESRVRSSIVFTTLFLVGYLPGTHCRCLNFGVLPRRTRVSTSHYSETTQGLVSGRHRVRGRNQDRGVPRVRVRPKKGRVMSPPRSWDTLDRHNGVSVRETERAKSVGDERESVIRGRTGERVRVPRRRGG